MASETIRHGRATVELIQGDALVVLATQDPASVDAVVTSPPYNLGIDYASYDDAISRRDYLAWTRRWVEAVQRVLSPSGSLFLNVAGKPKDPWVPFEVAQVCRDLGLVLQNTIHWVKSITVEKDGEPLSVGHYKPINSGRFLNDCVEFVFHFTPAGDVPLDRLAIGVPYQDKSNVSRWKGAARDVHCRGNAWFVPYATIQSRDKERPHPASFPPRLARMALELHGVERIGRTLDPFSGIGSTALACLDLGVDHVGIELDPGYHREAVRRCREKASEPFPGT